MNNNSNVQIIVQSPHQQTLELHIQTLIKSWLRRKTWKSFFTDNSNEHTSRWRTKLVKFLESKQVRAVAILFLLLDLVLTTLELSFSLLSCNPCNNRERRQENDQTTWYHWIGITILGLLMAKTLSLAVALGGSSLIRRPGLVIDGVVLAVALVLEAFLESKGGGLVVVVSLWRVVRVVESAFELSDDAIEAQIEEIVVQFERLKEENKTLLVSIDERDKAIELLTEDLDRCRQDCPCLQHHI